MPPITVAQGPTVSRGLLSVLGIGMDLGGPGAAAFGGTFVDPLDSAPYLATHPDGHELAGEQFESIRTGTGWLRGYQPVGVPCRRLTGLQPGFPCGPGQAFNLDEDAEYPEGSPNEGDPIPVVDLSTAPFEIGDMAYPFEIEGPNINCSTLGIGGWTDAEAKDASASALRDLLWRGIANELWTGRLADEQGYSGNKRLAGPDTIVLGEGVSLPYALFLLEGAVADMSSREERALIHSPFSMLPFFACDSQLVSTPNSDRYYTPGGSLIVPDVGYPGSSPTAPLVTPAPDEDTGEVRVWLYATLRVSARLDEPYQRQGVRPMSAGTAVRTTTNDVTLAHRQPAAVTFPCDVFGVSVAIGG